MKNSYGIILLLLTFVCLSCGRQSVKPVADATNTTTPAQKVYGNPTLENGYLVFEDEAHFQNIYADILAHPEKIGTWKKQISGFVSMQDAYESISETEREIIGRTGDISKYEHFLELNRDTDGSVEADIKTLNGIIANFVDANGVMKVGNVGVRYTKTQKIIMANFTKTQYSELINANENNSLPNIKIVNIRNLENKIRGTWSLSYNYYWHGSAYKRVRGESWVTDEFTDIDNLFTHSAIVSETKHQRRLTGIWWAANSTKLSVVGTGSVALDVDCAETSTSLTSPTGSQNNTSSYTKEVDHRTSFTTHFSGYSCYSTGCNVHLTHTAKRDDNGQNINVFTQLIF